MLRKLGGTCLFQESTVSGWMWCLRKYLSVTWLVGKAKQNWTELFSRDSAEGPDFRASGTSGTNGTGDNDFRDSLMLHLFRCWERYTTRTTLRIILRPNLGILLCGRNTDTVLDTVLTMHSGCTHTHTHRQRQNDITFSVTGWQDKSEQRSPRAYFLRIFVFSFSCNSSQKVLHQTEQRQSSTLRFLALHSEYMPNIQKLVLLLWLLLSMLLLPLSQLLQHEAFYFL